MGGKVKEGLDECVRGRLEARKGAVRGDGARTWVG
jgi:hypothetical protein